MNLEEACKAYMVDQRIGCDVVVTGQFCQRQAFTALGRGGRRARLFGWHGECDNDRSKRLEPGEHGDHGDPRQSARVPGRGVGHEGESKVNEGIAKRGTAQDQGNTSQTIQ